MKYSVLYRESLMEENEISAIEKYFPAYRYHTEIPPQQTIIGRYSVLPFYDWVSEDIKSVGSELINSPSQHRWIANFHYYDAIKNITPETWFRAVDVPNEGPFIVKGTTNGRKHNWNKFMFAPTRTDAIEKAVLLQEDSLIGQQDIVFRKYHPLETYEIGVNGLPITNEWRVFCFRGKILSYGYYWSLANNADQINANGPGSGFLEFAEEAARRCVDSVNFYVIDIARTVSGEWIVIELNDAQMSGLSMVDPLDLWGNLRKEIDR